MYVHSRKRSTAWTHTDGRINKFAANHCEGEDCEANGAILVANRRAPRDPTKAPSKGPLFFPSFSLFLRRLLPPIASRFSLSLFLSLSPFLLQPVFFFFVVFFLASSSSSSSSSSSLAFPFYHPRPRYRAFSFSRCWSLGALRPASLPTYHTLHGEDTGRFSISAQVPLEFLHTFVIIIQTSTTRCRKSCGLSTATLSTLIVPNETVSSPLDAPETPRLEPRFSELRFTFDLAITDLK